MVGWCCLWERCGGVAVECVKVNGVELCLACAKRELIIAERMQSA